MRGYPVGYCVTSSVDPEKGLFYAGYPVADMAHWKPEKVIYLIYNGEEGSAEKIEEFSNALRQEKFARSESGRGGLSSAKERTSDEAFFVCIAYHSDVRRDGRLSGRLSQCDC